MRSIAEIWHFLRGTPPRAFREDRFWAALEANADFSPVFFLSTGRSGTLFFTRLLQRDSRILVAHNPYPELIAQSRIAYEYTCAAGGAELPLLAQVFAVARQQVLADCLADGRTYIETNNRITFFAPALQLLFPRARFVHLYRHPVAFVRSGLARHWYDGGSNHEIGRIVPRPGTPEAAAWGGWSSVERIAWLWAETNACVGRFLSGVPDDRKMAMYFAEPGAAEVARVLSFCGATLPADLPRLVQEPVNPQRNNPVPEWDAWSVVQREALLRQAGPEAARLGLTL